MSDRFYSAEPISGDRATLTGSESHHLLHVMRAEIGERVTLFDGSGREFVAEISHCGRSEVELAVLQSREVDRELAFELTVGMALPKGDRQKWLVEKLTELGASRLVPLVTERGVAQPTGGAIERLERTVIEASKQCGRNRLLRIAPPVEWQAFIQQPTEKLATSAVKLIADPAGGKLAELTSDPSTDTVTAVGPEGGFTPAESDAATAAGWRPVSLGPRILRVETAAVALVAAVVALCDRP